MAVAIGLVMSAGSVQVPAPIDTVLGLMAPAAPPTALIVIGVSLAGLKLGGMKLDLGLVAGAKLLLHPLCVALMLMLWQPPVPAMGVAALLYAAMPMMSIYPVLGPRHHHESFFAGPLLAATVASFVAVNVLVALAPALTSMRWPPCGTTVHRKGIVSSFRPRTPAPWCRRSAKFRSWRRCA